MIEIDPAQIQKEIIRSQREFSLGILNLAEASLPRNQFRSFKKILFRSYHCNLVPETKRILKILHQARPVATHGNFGEKEVEP